MHRNWYCTPCKLATDSSTPRGSVKCAMCGKQMEPIAAATTPLLVQTIHQLEIVAGNLEAAIESGDGDTADIYPIIEKLLKKLKGGD